MKLRKKTMATLLIAVFLLSTLTIAIPVSADTQTVTGETVIPYIVTATVAFGPVAPSTTETVLDVITSNVGNTISVTAASQSGGTVDALEELRYVAGTVPGTPDSDLPEKIWCEDTPVSSWAAITLDAGAQLSMEADTGTVAGTWGTITITFTVT